MGYESTRSVVLSVRSALRGVLTPNLYGACALLDRPDVVLTWYVSPELTEDELEDLQVAGTEVLCDLKETFGIQEHLVEVRDRSVPLPTVGEWAMVKPGFRVSGDS